MRYGQSQYGLSRYAENIPNKEDLKKYFVDLTKYVPSFISNLKEIKAIYDAQGMELGSLYYCIDDLINQCFIDTATWGLVYWEQEYGIETNLNYSYEERREILKAKKRGQGTCTKALIKNAAEAFSGGECNVIENTGPYEFTIQFVGVKGIPRNLQAFKDMLDNIKPAHLDYKFKYTYTNWNYLDGKNLSYNNADSIAWDDLEIYD
ncbi:YmfQ family protein [Clostridium weizhouense]|uniref:YmfQ family protein n=1 Tax=Clostridium weizhouense TaxID=2859781 RepID=A0ABS7AJV9_9CLOT|nr:YmfQ family protein [Clostridium weizhouense]MBW6408955.1 YmfQ family protein [Clostridium weizhouense]